MPGMAQLDIEEYLAGRHIAHLATLNPDGSPHLIPIWYLYETGKIYMIGGSGVKARNIKNDPRVVVSITGPEQPYKYVLIEGTAQLITQGIEQLTLTVATRYMGEERGNGVRQRDSERSDARDSDHHSDQYHNRVVRSDILRPKTRRPLCRI